MSLSTIAILIALCLAPLVVTMVVLAIALSEVKSIRRIHESRMTPQEKRKVQGR